MELVDYSFELLLTAAATGAAAKFGAAGADAFLAAVKKRVGKRASDVHYSHPDGYR